MLVVSGAKQAKKNLRRWMRPRGVATPLHMLPGRSRLEPQPLGVVGVMAPWNYPFNLTFAPTIAAAAAGNRVMIKPSELTPHLGEVVKEMISNNFDPAEFCVVTGDIETSKAFSEIPFDHLFFTGSPNVGRMVAMAAARNLTPVTLELGGKSPAIIDASANLESATTSITHGKVFNAGQTCIAPDYVLIPRAKMSSFTEAFKTAAHKMLPEMETTPDYSSIISDRHYDRLRSVIDEAREAGAEVIEIGPVDELANQRKLPLTLVVEPPEGTRIREEEIFGPVLMVLASETPDAAISHINVGERPLALYWFGDNHEVRDRFLQQTVAGGVVINDCLWQYAQENLPFGGIGNSGVGAYHGEAGFDTFSHMKPVFYQSRFSQSTLLHPPYTSMTDKILSLLRKII